MLFLQSPCCLGHFNMACWLRLISADALLLGCTSWVDTLPPASWLGRMLRRHGAAGACFGWVLCHPCCGRWLDILPLLLVDVDTLHHLWRMLCGFASMIMLFWWMLRHHFVGIIGDGVFVVQV